MQSATLRRIVRTTLPKWYLQRFPLLLGAFLSGYVVFALWVVPAMFRSTLVLTGWGLTAVTTFALLAAMIVMTTRRTILLCGSARFGLTWAPPRTNVTAVDMLRHALCAVPMIVAAVWLSAAAGGLGIVPALAHTGLGIIAASVCVYAAAAAHAWLTNANQPLPDLALPNTSSRFRSLHRRNVPGTWAGTMVQRLLVMIRPCLGAGYFTAKGRVEPAHVYATAMFIVFGLIYGGAYVIGNPAFDNGVPALVFGLLLVTLATIVLSGIAFLLDRNRLPTLLPVIAWMTFLSWVSNSDHYVRLKTVPDALSAPTPYEIARARRPLLTVVAIDGGGIQAAAWGATVLTHIEREWRDFHKSVGVLSAVSGGSVGTLYFVSALREDRAVTDQELDGVVAAAVRPSLGEAAWGLTYGDLWRALVPYRFEEDRGWAMERAWRRNFQPEKVPTLGHWIAGVRKAWMPSVALNATVVESGQRFAFATFAPPEQPARSPADPRPWNLGTILATYPFHDIDMPTAARLSSTFPYVTPIATVRSDTPVQPWHFADGGYYDNTGMGIAMRWLDTAMHGHEAEFANVAVAFIQIRSSPAGQDARPRERAWAYDAVGPIQALLNVRVAGQRERAESELEFLQRLWRKQGVEIVSFEFGFDAKEPPLSWQLTEAEKTRLETEWMSPANQTNVRRYLALRDAATPRAAASPAVK